MLSLPNRKLSIPSASYYTSSQLQLGLHSQTAAILEENNDSIAAAIHNYNTSLRSKNGSDKQKTFTYERLGNLNFNRSNYILASAYYDSVLQVAKNTKDSLHLRIRRVKSQQPTKAKMSITSIRQLLHLAQPLAVIIADRIDHE